MATVDTAAYSFDLGVKSVVTEEDGDLILEGFASTYGSPDETDFQNEYFENGAWSQAVIDEFLAGGAPCLANHDADRPLGTIVSGELRPGGLWVKALIPKPAPGSWADREDWYMRIKRGIIRGMSVSGKFARRVGADGIARIYKSTLAEISLSPHPINPKAIGTVSLANTAQKAFASSNELRDVRDYLEQARADATQLRMEQIQRKKSMVNGKDYYIASQTSPVPLEAAEMRQRNRPRPTQQQVAINRDREARRQASVQDGTKTERAVEIDLQRALIGAPEEVADPFAAAPIDASSGEIGGADLQRLFGVKPAPPLPPLTPNQIFDRAEREERDQRLSDEVTETASRLARMLKTKEQS